MLTHKRKICPVCGEEFIYTNVREIPATCYKRMCQVNYRAFQNRSTMQGDKPSLKEMGIWGPSKDYKKSEKLKTKK